MKTLKIFLSFALVLLGMNVYSQMTINGNVTDENGTPLPGATILIVGTNQGSTSDFNGEFSIEASEGSTLSVQFVGYLLQEIQISDDSSYSVSLQPDSLSEVVVTALGISREKKSLGYAVSEISGGNVNTIKDNNLANSLSGKVAGLQISQSGSLGSSSRITIRGNNSLGGNTQALIVVDGMPINSSIAGDGEGNQFTAGSNDGGGQPSYEPSISGGGITDINPDDVESVTVLKGPSAAALYGSRAGNGVILITTKKGSRSNKLGVSVKTNLYVDNPMLLPDFQNQYGQGLLGAAFPERGTGTAWARDSWGAPLDGSSQPYYDGSTKSYSARPDNVSSFFRSAFRNITSVSLDKGSESGSVRFSYTNNSSESMIEGSDLNSHNFNLRGVADLSDKLSIDAKATYFTQEVTNRASTNGAQGLLGYVYGMPRNVITNDLRNYQLDNPATPDEFAVIKYDDGLNGNPYWMTLHDENVVRRNRFLGFFKINYNFTDWLNAFIRVGADVTNVRDNRILKPGRHFENTGYLRIGENSFGELNSEFLVTANRDLTDKLNLVANVGGNMSKRTYEGMVVSGRNFKIPTRFFVSNLNELAPPLEFPQQIKKVNSFYGSVNLAYDNFLYLDVSARNDWSSTLSEENRSYMYNSASLSALLNQFIDPAQDFLDLFKIRASIAEVGNDTDPYQLNQTFTVPGAGYLGLTELQSPRVKFNSNLKPETVTSSEFGLELSMLKNRLTLDVAVYNITTKDLIFDVPVPAATGFQFDRSNIGKVTNNGVEIALGATLLKTSDLSWNTSLFYSKNENKIEELIDGLDSFVYNTSTDGNLSIRATAGGSLGDIYGREWTGEVDANGAPIASDVDILLGNGQPDWLGGWSNNISYKDFTLSFVIDARIGGKVYSQTSADLDRIGASKRSLEYRESGIVVQGNNTETGSANTVNVSGQDYWNAMSAISENYLYDQDNIRLRELSIGYRIPRVDAIGLQSANLQLVGRNLFFISKSAEDIDPEVMLGTSLGIQGMSHNPMPTIRSVGMNLTLNF
ncbi:MAG: SusC/RagA family TonB-linked outer membrane protein [Flavobacteriaceae bacterium]|nr:SusC/RagA family TonB-linked outer membrane protein [Flavobacteriaceae bacterium]